VPASASAHRETETRIISGIIRSGVALLDDWLTGVRDGGIHLLTGGCGSGKSTLALHFADAALRRGQSVAMIVHSRADDVKSHARYLGIDVDAPLRDGRLLLLRYRETFVHDMTHAVSPAQVIDDLERVVEPHRPARIILDTVSPLVCGSGPLAPVVAALVASLERAGSTSLLTFPEDVSSGYDRSLEPLVSASSAIIRLSVEDSGIRRAELVSLRYPMPATTTTRFVVRAGVGLVGEHAVRPERLALRVP
jgi:circadian clock protein KaiC